jgi:hypothetical protein
MARAKFKYRIRQVGDDLVFQRWTGSILGAVLVLGWRLVWTGAASVMVRQVIVRPNLENVLYALPVLAMLYPTFFLPWRLLFGFEQIRLGPRGLEHRWGALIPLGRQIVPLAEIQRATHYCLVQQGGFEYGIKVQTLGRSLRFAGGTELEERVLLVDHLQRHLQALDPTVPRAPEGGAFAVDVEAPGAAATGEEAGEYIDREIESKGLIPLRRGDTPVEILRPGANGFAPPWDSQVQMHYQWDHLAFMRKGAVSLGGIGALFCLNLFWNGLIGLFVLKLTQHFDLLLFVFMIPFEVLGLLLLYALLTTILAPFYRACWMFQPGQVTHRTSILGCGRTVSHEIYHLGRLELRRTPPVKPSRFLPDTTDEERHYALGMVCPEGGDVAVIDGLTEGEGRWMAAQLLEHFPDWLVRGRN